MPTSPTGTVQPLQQQPAEWIANGQLPVWANQAGVDPVTQQMLWWQQTYAQQYWTQYMHQISSQGHHPQAAYPAAPAPVPPVPQAAAVGPDPGRPVQPEEQQQQQPRRQPVAAVGGVAQDEDDDGIRAARDWLDWIYMGSRLAILLGVMYYYSSLPRFMLVTLIVAGIYLYQKAIHQRRHLIHAPQRHGPEVNNNNGGQAAEAQPPQPAQPPAVVPVPAPEVQAPAADADPAVANANRAPEAPAVAAISPTAFNVAINVLIGFFSSLIPEVPAPEALN